MTNRTRAHGIPAEYVEMLARDGHDDVPAFLHASGELFDGIDLAGKDALEIGSGRGLLALLMGLQGAARVVSMEPELVGATSGVIALQRDRIEALALGSVQVVVADFNTWDPGTSRFDLILSHASINHLYASDCHALHDSVTYENYLRIVKKVHSLLKPGGVFIASDACRYALFAWLGRLGIRRPWRRKKSGVNWRHHQNPGTWKRIFREAGFDRVAVQYPVPHRLRHLAPLVATPAANFVLKGSFVLRAYR